MASAVTSTDIISLHTYYYCRYHNTSHSLLLQISFHFTLITIVDITTLHTYYYCRCLWGFPGHLRRWFGQSRRCSSLCCSDGSLDSQPTLCQVIDILINNFNFFMFLWKIFSDGRVYSPDVSRHVVSDYIMNNKPEENWTHVS